ncbi:MAG: LPS export ABC transporter permease LptG [Desulfobacteraceae bacterium]|nr:LPS export ABC transporter permease LptG [Desulfobacteraceae bacterium]
MNLLEKYITVEILKQFCIILVAVVGIYLVVDFIEKVDDFIEAGAPTFRVLIFLAYKIPFIVAQIAPVGVLLASLITFGLMNKNNELIALRSSGINCITLLGPALKFGIVIGLCLFLNSEFLSPYTTMQSNRVLLKDVKKKTLATTRRNDMWLKKGKAIYHFKLFHPGTKTAQGFTYNEFDSNFRLIRRLDAQSGQFKDGRWILEKVIEQLYYDERNRYGVKIFPQKIYNLGLTLDNVAEAAPHSSEMSIRDLSRQIKRVEEDGYDASIYKVDLYAKIAFPFSCLVMAVIGLGIAARGSKREGMVSGIVYGLGIVFIYWIFFSFCNSLGNAGLLPPFIASWLANILFTCFGLVLVFHAQ